VEHEAQHDPHDEQYEASEPDVSVSNVTKVQLDVRCTEPKVDVSNETKTKVP
jgi:hypothetical protein